MKFKNFLKKKVKSIAIFAVLPMFTIVVNADEVVSDGVGTVSIKADADEKHDKDKEFLSLDELKKLCSIEEISKYVDNAMKRLKDYQAEVKNLQKEFLQKRIVELKDVKKLSSDSVSKEVKNSVKIADKNFDDVVSAENVIREKIRDAMAEETQREYTRCKEGMEKYLEDPREFTMNSLKAALEPDVKLSPRDREEIENLLNSPELFEKFVAAETKSIKIFYEHPEITYSDEQLDAIMGSDSKIYWYKAYNLEELVYTLYEKILISYEKFQKAEEVIKNL